MKKITLSIFLLIGVIIPFSVKTKAAEQVTDLVSSIDGFQISQNNITLNIDNTYLTYKYFLDSNSYKILNVSTFMTSSTTSTFNLNKNINYDLASDVGPYISFYSLKFMYNINMYDLYLYFYDSEYGLRQSLYIGSYSVLPLNDLSSNTDGLHIDLELGKGKFNILDVQNESYINGYDKGYNDGLDSGYLGGYIEGVESGVTDVQNNPNDYGLYNESQFIDNYNKGLSDASTNSYNLVNLMLSVFSGLGVFLSFELLPGISLGGLIAIPLVFGIIFFIIGHRPPGGKDNE